MDVRQAYKKCYSDLRYYFNLPGDARDPDDLNSELREHPKVVVDAAWDSYAARFKVFNGFRGGLRGERWNARIHAYKLKNDPFYDIPF